MNVLEFKKKLIKARDGIQQETAKIILKFEKQIVDLVRENQIFQDGEDGSGNIIGVYKVSFNRPFEHSNTRGYPKIKGTQVNLFDRGDLYKSFTTDYGSFVLEVFPTDNKADELMSKYGNDIFFMQTKNKEIVNFNIILPELQKFVKNTLR
jgi:hypothetical protein